MRVGIEERYARYIIEKGSVAVDGISLTVNRCGNTFFEVNIIPQTGRATTLLKKRVGDSLNIETDLIGKYVERILSMDKSGRKEGSFSNIDMEMLFRQGFSE